MTIEMWLMWGSGVHMMMALSYLLDRRSPLDAALSVVSGVALAVLALWMPRP